MNILFTLLFFLCAFLLFCANPENFLSALLSGASKSASVCVSLISTYTVWLGLMQVWEDSGLTKKISTLLKPISKKIFYTDDDATLNAVCMNLSVNMLGISGAATPYGIQAAALLNKSPKADYANALFFILNATSLQLFPTSIIGVRVAMQSAAPNSVVLPIILTSAFSTALGVLLCVVFIKKTPSMRTETASLFAKTQGAGTQ